MDVGHRRPVVTIEPLMRRRAANALLSNAAALAKLADQIDELRHAPAPTPEQRSDLAALERQSDALRADYQAALYRFRAVHAAATGS